MAPATYVLETALDLLTFDGATGRLVSLRRKAGPDAELLATSEADPAFALQYLTAEREYRHVDSRSAGAVEATLERPETGCSLTFAFTDVGGLGIDVRLTVRASLAEPLSRWSLTLANHSGLTVVDVQFPFVVVAPTPGTSLLRPTGYGGSLIEGEALSRLPLDEPGHWQMRPENGDFEHYPGWMFAQLLATCGPAGGVYLACDDTEGNVKLLKATRRGDGVRLGVAHVGDWPIEGERTLEYEVGLRTFEGDWYEAAAIYREWALRQKWAKPLRERTEIPRWLLDSPPHITIRLQGYLDDGPAPPIEEFLPYEKCIPLLESVAKRLDSPLVAVLMSWERGGPWVYPDCFPPVGGDESLTRFCAMARERGWEVGSFCNGTRWVVRHLMNGYEGTEYFERHEGALGACRRHDGELWAEHWDQGWRPSYASCMGAEQTRAIARDFVRRLIGWGMRSIQFFDQNCNAATFPCFSTDHGHPPVPGKWMARAMAETVAAFREAAREAGAEGVIQSTENPCNEYCLPLFDQSDARVSTPSAGAADFVPLYHYLYHECTVLHGMMSIGPEPYSLPMRAAWNGVLGEIGGAVLTGDGTLLNRETGNWAPWTPKVGSEDDAFAMMRAASHIRGGVGREFLVYGRMERPAEVDAETITWLWDGRSHSAPAIAHAAWRAAAGGLGLVLANWTQEAQPVRVRDGRLGGEVTVHSYAWGETATRQAVEDGTLELVLEPLSFALVEIDAPTG